MIHPESISQGYKNNIRSGTYPQIIGEATKNLPYSLKLSHPEVPWKDMAGFREEVVDGLFWCTEFRFGIIRKSEIFWELH